MLLVYLLTEGLYVYCRERGVSRLILGVTHGRDSVNKCCGICHLP